MANVLIVAYLLIVLALITVILLQRSEGGGLGMGSGPTGLMTVRGSANLLTRTTAVLAALFFATAIGLTVLTEIDRGSSSILDRAADAVGEGAGDETSVLDALNALGGDSGLALPEGGTTAPAAETTAPAAETAPATDPGLAVPTTPGSGTETTAPATGEPAAEGAPAAPVN
jgi:preprotein translocase subunit SecG